MNRVVAYQFQQFSSDARWFLAAVAIAFVASIGCVSHTFDDPYKPTQDAIASAGQISVHIDVISDRGSATDTQVGHYGRREVILSAPYEPWLAAGLRGEYRRAGFDVVDTPEEASTHVNVEILDVFSERARACQPFADCVGAVAIFDVEITEPTTGDRFHRRFVGSSDRTKFSTSIRDLEDELRTALGEAYAEIVTETYALLSSPPPS